MKLIGKGIASGKIILAGEHAVVYNQPAIAVPFFAAQIETLVTKAPVEHLIECDYYKGTLREAPTSINGLRTIILNVMDYLRKDTHPVNIDIISSLPSGSGLGSSASVSVSVVRALFDYFDCEINDSILYDLVETSERIYHLNPSGIDMRTIINSKPVWFENRDDIKVISSQLSGYIIVADSGIKGNTKEAVSEVRELIREDFEEINKKMESIGEAVRSIQTNLFSDRLREVGHSMTYIHNLLKSINVSNDTLDRLVDSALSAGALGAKLTGSGKGGCVIALAHDTVSSQKVAKAMETEGATQTWIYSLKGDI